MERVRQRNNPEKQIQRDIENYLRARNWFVKRTHGNAFSEGWPDIFASHRLFGIRWIEVKLPEMKGSQFTPAQLATFPQMLSNGCGVWILTGATQVEYNKLFQKPNVFEYILLKM